MNTQFSIQRIGLLLRKDWIEYRKKVMLYVLIFIGVFAICLLWPMRDSLNAFNPSSLYLFGLIGSAIVYFRYVSQAVHQPKGLFLTLPANTSEKFVTLLLEGVTIFIVFHGLFWAAVGFGSWILPIKQFDMANLWYELSGLSVSLFLSSIMFLSFVSFRKFALGITICIYFSMLAALVGVVYLLQDIVLKSNGEVDFNLDFETWIPNLVVPIFSLLTIGVLYLAYIRLKRKELR